MKQIMILSFFLMATVVVAQNNDAVTIEVEIVNVANEEGQILIGLYDSEESWLKIPAKGTYGKITNGKSAISFANIPNGTYAIAVFHDKDNDGELDAILGIPTEDTGSSNDAPARFGPPTWEGAKFEVKGNIVKQTIKL